MSPGEIEHGIVNVLRWFESPGALVFCHTREAVKRLNGSLLERGFATVALSGEMGQNERNHALQALRDGRARVCVATDVAARGIDLPGLDLVIHAELPRGKETLLHRSGRTGRAGRKGVCVLITPFNRRRRTELLLQQAGLEAEWRGAPSAEEVRRRDQERLLQDPVFSEEASDEDLATARLLMTGRTPEEIAAAFVRAMRSRLPEPEDVYDPGPQRERPARKARTFDSEHDAPETRTSYDPVKVDRATGPMVWFRMGIGRQKNADPRWLLPLICRRGHVTRKEIGAIRIFERETKFEITQDAAERFAQAALGKVSKGETIRFERSEPPGSGDMRREERERPQGEAPRREKPTGDRDRREARPEGGDRPFRPHKAGPRAEAPAHEERARPPFKKRRERDAEPARKEDRGFEARKPGPPFKKNKGPHPHPDQGGPGKPGRPGKGKPRRG